MAYFEFITQLNEHTNCPKCRSISIFVEKTVCLKLISKCRETAIFRSKKEITPHTSVALHDFLCR